MFTDIFPTLTPPFFFPNFDLLLTLERQQRRVGGREERRVGGVGGWMIQMATKRYSRGTLSQSRMLQYTKSQRQKQQHAAGLVVNRTRIMLPL